MSDRITFETRRIYRVSPEDNCLEDRSGRLTLVDGDALREDLHLPFWVTGVERHDLAVFATSIDEECVEDHGLLVVSSCQNQGQLATPELIEDFDCFLTPELAKKIATLKEEELAQLGIDSLVRRLRRSYPGIKGFIR